MDQSYNTNPNALIVVNTQGNLEVLLDSCATSHLTNDTN